MQFQFSNWDTKNMGEFKNVLGATVRGNVFRNCLFPTWGNQKCRSFLLNLTGEQDGPASTLAEISFVNNKFYHAPGGIEEGGILCDGNNKFIASKIIRGNPTQLLDSGCSFLPGDRLFIQGAPATGPWAALNGYQDVIALGTPGFGGDAFIPLDTTAFPAPNFDVSVFMDIKEQGVNRRPRDITIENNIVRMGHPTTITGGYIGGARQFSTSQTSTYWYSFDIGRMTIAPFDTTWRHNTVVKPEYGYGFAPYLSIVAMSFPFQTDLTVETIKPRYTNEDNVWEGNVIIGYNGESPCTKALETYAQLPMLARGNIATNAGVSMSGTTFPPAGYDKYGCEGFRWEFDRPGIGYTDYYKDNFRLSSASKYRNTGSDGSDPGADQNVVDWETEGAISGEYNPYLTMEIKSVAPDATSSQFDYIGYDTSACSLDVSTSRAMTAPLSATHTRTGRRGTATVSGLKSRTNYWARLTCAGRYRDLNFSTF